MPKHEVVTLPQRPGAAHSIADIEKLAEAVARSRMFGITTKEQAMVLMAISQAEGRHPALAARDYDIISGRPAKKAEAMMRDFLEAGGKVKWHQLDDTTADATFSHPSGGEIRILWDTKRAMTAGLAGRDMWKKFPRQMLRSRCVSEGVKTVYPMATSGFYTAEEVSDMPAMALPEAPSDTTADLDQFAAVTGDAEDLPPRDILAEAHDKAEHGTADFTTFWQSLSMPERDSIRQHMAEFKDMAVFADKVAAKHARQAGAEDNPDDPFGLLPLPAAEPLPEPAQPVAGQDVFAELEHEARAATRDGKAAFEQWWKTLRGADKALMQPFKGEYERLAEDADTQRGLAL
jgi:hypothetical protein